MICTRNSPGTKQQKLEVPSDLPSVKSGVYNYLEIDEKKNEHNLEMS